MQQIEFISFFKTLDKNQQKDLLRNLQSIADMNDYDKVLSMRGDALDAKAAECPHCDSPSYHKFGKDKGARRYKCNQCHRTFTEYTGTWISGIHKKELIPEFLRTMQRNLSLKQTGKEMNISEVTAFNWRHKLFSAVEQDDNIPFKGLTEIDETHYTHSQKGKKCTNRAPRKRGGASSRGVSNEQATVITAMDRNANLQLDFTNMGRISVRDVETCIGHRVSDRTILCSDAHKSYQSFAQKKDIEHYQINISKGERVKGTIHIQHINSLHSRIRHLLNYDRKGVSTKYLQKYLNWQKINEMFKNTYQWVRSVLLMSMKQPKAVKIFRNIEDDYEKIIKPTLF